MQLQARVLEGMIKKILPRDIPWFLKSKSAQKRTTTRPNKQWLQGVPRSCKMNQL